MTYTKGTTNNILKFAFLRSMNVDQFNKYIYVFISNATNYVQMGHICILFQVETLGDAVYMVAGGVPDRKANHATSTAHVATEVIHGVKYRNLSGNSQASLQVKIGRYDSCTSQIRKRSVNTTG